jgi:integrase
MNMMEKTMRFGTVREARTMPAPEALGKTHVDYKHVAQTGFFVRVMRPDAQGNIRRVWVHRYKTRVPDGAGGWKEKDHKDTLGNVDAVYPGDVVMPLDRALAKVLAARAALTGDGETRGGAPRLTVAAAWAHYDIENALHRPATREKDQATFERYYSHFQDKFLDELPYSFWASFTNQLLHGKLNVGIRINEHGRTDAMLLGPLAAATMRGVINVGVTLYELARKYEGLRGVGKDFNPPREAKKLIPEPNKKKTHIALESLGRAWRAAEQLCAPWWTDLFKCYLLTGLRRSLMVDMRFDEIDWEGGRYIIDPHKRGTKRKGSRLASNADSINMPLCKAVMAILKARREFAPDKNGWVWYAARPLRGTRSDDAKRLSDPRSSWVLIEKVIGDVHFATHDLRRTFATAGGACASELFALSLLLMHSSSTLAKAVGIPGITLDYINTDGAQKRMRAAAEEISDFIHGLARESTERGAPIIDPVLPDYIEEALQLEAA